MAIIVNNPSGESESNVAFIIGLIILLAIVALFIIYVWPGLRVPANSPTPPETPNTTNVEIDLPSPLPPNPTTPNP